MTVNQEQEEEADRKLISAEEGFLGNTVIDSHTSTNTTVNLTNEKRPPLKRYRNSMNYEAERDESTSMQDMHTSLNIDTPHLVRDDPILVTTSKNATINLRDILQNPYEDEAETTIIKAIESRVHEHEECNIFPEIPEESERLFNQPQADAIIQQSSVDVNNLDTKHRTISMGDVSLTSFRSIKTNPSTILHPNQNVAQVNASRARVDTLSDMAEQMRTVQMRTFEGRSESGFLARAAKNVSQPLSPIEDRRPSMGGASALHVELTSNNNTASTIKDAIQQQKPPPPPGFEAKSTDSLYKHAEQIYATATQDKYPHSILRNRLRTESTTGGMARIPENDTNAQDCDPAPDNYTSLTSTDNDDPDAYEKKTEKKKRKGSSFRKSIYSSLHNTRQKVILEWELLAPILKTDLVDVQTYVKRLLILFVIVLIISVVLFYGFKNPVEPHTKASYSWWILFILVRQVITFTLAKVTQYLIIDVIAMKTFLVRCYLGPVITLFIIQSKGWPFLSITWSAWDFLLLFGDRKFCDHWLHRQERVKLFNESNPSGNILVSKVYANILICGVVGGLLGALKKVWVAWFLGRKKFGMTYTLYLPYTMSFFTLHLPFTLDNS